MTKVNVYDSVSNIECEHKELSNEFDIKVLSKKFTYIDQSLDSTTVKLILSDKSTNNIIDSLLVTSHFYFGEVFKDCKNVLSYTTKINIDKQIVDNYYGDIIVADLNFDNKDDIAVINDSGGNGGPFYKYYLQVENNFILDKFLTDSMTYFPQKINKQKKTLTTYVHAGVCGLGEHIYYFDSANRKWKEKNHRIINICK